MSKKSIYDTMETLREVGGYFAAELAMQADGLQKRALWIAILSEKMNADAVIDEIERIIKILQGLQESASNAIERLKEIKQLMEVES